MPKFDHNQICTTDKSVEVDGKYQYYEDGMTADVTVLEDLSDSEGISFRLRVDGVLNGPFEVGGEFSPWAARGLYAYSGMWRLYSLNEYAVL